MGAQNFKEEDWGDGDTFCVSEIELKISKRVAILVKLFSAPGTNAHYVWPRDFHEKMPATADFRLRPQRGLAL